MKKLWLAIVSAGPLLGCATFGQLEEGLAALMGRDQREAIAALGYPSGQMIVMGDTVYVWQLSRGGAIFLPTTTTTYGNVGATPFYGTTTGTQMVPVNYACEIKLAADANGRLRSWDYHGNLGGCTPLIQRLNAYIKGRS